MPTVLILPGHGGFCPGAVNSVLKVKEADGNLSVALKLSDLLKHNGFNTKLSRTTDVACGGATNVSNDVGNQIRFVNNNQGDIAVAIHFNSFSDKNANGVEVIYSSLNPGFNNNTIKLANLLQNQLVKDTGMRNRGVKEINQGIGIIKGTNKPTVLSENGFISNDAESIWCSSDKHNLILAKSHAIAICQYFGIQFKELNQNNNTNNNITPDNAVKLLINGRNVDFPVRLVNGRTEAFVSEKWITVRDLSNLLKAELQWDANTRTANLIIK